MLTKGIIHPPSPETVVEAASLLTDLRRLGFALSPQGDRLQVVPGSKLTPELRQAIQERKAELLVLLSKQQEVSCQPAADFQPKTRPFLPRPLGQEDNPDPWTVWSPLFTWLLEHYPDRYHSVCEAEDAISVLERAGIQKGEEYEQACAELLWRFEEARRLKLREGIKIWFQ